MRKEVTDTMTITRKQIRSVLTSTQIRRIRDNVENWGLTDEQFAYFAPKCGYAAEFGDEDPKVRDNARHQILVAIANAVIEVKS